MHDDAVEADQRQEIWYCHQGIHAVGNVPHNSEVRHTAGKDCHDVEQTVGVGPALALDIFYCTLAVIAPSENGAEGESEQTEA